MELNRATLQTQLQQIAVKAGELSVLLEGTNFPDDYHRFIHSLTNQADHELGFLIETVSKDKAAGKVTGSNNSE